MSHTSFDWGSIALNIFLVLLLVVLNGFFVAAEFALVKVRETRLQQLYNEGVVKAKYALTVTKKLDVYLSATQLGITLASLGLGWIGEPAVTHLIVDPLFALLHWNSAWYSSVLSVFIGFAVITFYISCLESWRLNHSRFKDRKGLHSGHQPRCCCFTKYFSRQSGC